MNFLPSFEKIPSYTKVFISMYAQVGYNTFQVHVADVDWIKISSQEEISLLVCSDLTNNISFKLCSPWES